jgi:hypothetical protein
VHGLFGCSWGGDGEKLRRPNFAFISTIGLGVLQGGGFRWTPIFPAGERGF